MNYRDSEHGTLSAAIACATPLAHRITVKKENNPLARLVVCDDKELPHVQLKE
jgi:hypothetical protein